MLVLAGDMTDEQVTLLQHVESLFAAQNQQFAEFARQQSLEHAEVKTRLTGVELGLSKMGERIGDVETHVEVARAQDGARTGTLKTVGLVVSSTILGLTAITGMVIGILNFFSGG